VFVIQETRTRSNDWVVRYRNRLLPLEPVSRRIPARSTVQVCEARDGALTVRYRERAMPWHEIVPGHATMVRLTAPAPPSVPVPSRIPRPHEGPIIRGGSATRRCGRAITSGNCCASNGGRVGTRAAAAD
jgi:hypothetical protein